MPLQTHIHLLADEVINKIAAGEVVDRPASVLKELVENSLDAGARNLEIEIIEGGKKVIMVSDDGRGMSRDDALLSVERHATSKIREVEDIERVDTLGFRGEALAAISAVSRFSLVTRSEGEASGTELTMAGGKLLDVKDAGCPMGTKIMVRHLFHNVPARRKFLRSDQTELSHLRQVFLVYALSHPETGFRLVVDEREVYRLGGGAALEVRLRELFGAEMLAALKPLQWEAPGIRIRGLAGLPQVTRSDRSEQFTFINGRPASAPVIGHAMNEAYHTLIPRGRYPVMFLFIDVEPELVDVNVHPTKREVRFREAGAVRDAVIAAVRGALSLDATGAAALPPVRQLFTATRAAAGFQIPDLPTLPAFSYPRLPPRTGEAEPAPAGAAGAEAPAPVVPPVPGSPWSWCRILGQAGGLYVIMETEDGLIVMDPHAAHERVLYERFMRQVLQREVKTQGLILPESIELTPEDAERVRGNVEALRVMGFGVAEFGGDTFVVDALPVCLGNVSARAVLAEIAGTLEQGGRMGGTERWAEERIAQAACKASVKANDKLTLQEIESLVVDLAKSDMPYTCPHGRPTTIFMSFQELRKKFGRE